MAARGETLGGLRFGGLPSNGILLGPDTGTSAGGGDPSPQTSDMLRVFNTDFTNFDAATIQEARERQVLAGRVILILGVGPRGMGGAAAKEVALQGATVVVSSRADKDGNPKNQDMQDFVKTLGKNASWIGSDVAGLITHPDTGKVTYDSQRVIQEVAAETAYGRLDGLIITSGDIQNTGAFQKVTRDRTVEIYEQDALGPMFAIMAAADHMTKQNPPAGRIAVVGSISGAGNGFQIEYSMAKAAIHAGVIALGKELDFWRERAESKGRTRPEVFVNALAPGLVTTPPIEKYRQEIRDGIVRTSGAERELHPGEPGSMLAKLMGQYAGEINGQVIPMLGRGEIPSWLAA